MKHTFEIPEGCNRVTIERQGRQIITTFEPEFKDGDITCANTKESRGIHILKAIDGFYHHYYCALYEGENTSNSVVYDHCFNRADAIKSLRHATEEEKQMLFDAMAKDGKRWNAEAKQVEDIKPKRWRAEKNMHYWHLDSQLNASRDTEHGVKWDDMRYISGNYFISDDDAEAAAKKIKELLKQINP